MAHLLIVEDHENLRLSIRDCLEKEGYTTSSAGSLLAARKLLGEKPDLLVLDWMLGDGQGLDLLLELRKSGLTTPVIFLTARADIVDKVLGLELGANDYMTKPFEPRELIARVRVQLREGPKENTASLLKAGPLVVDRLKHTATFRGQKVELVKKEFELLVLFAESPEKVFSRDEILNKVWGYEVFPTTRTVDTHVMLLRQKLSDELIETVRSVGYKLNLL